MQLTRKQAWPEILAAEIKAAEMRPFSWGTHDCCAFAARVVEAMTGVNFMEDFPGYTDEASAASVIDEFDGVSGIAGLCLEEAIAVNFAQRGDVVLMPTDRGDALGICVDHMVAFASAKGLAFHPLSACRLAWRVG
jgi:hypothetical protein